MTKCYLVGDNGGDFSRPMRLRSRNDEPWLVILVEISHIRFEMTNLGSFGWWLEAGSWKLA